MSTRAQAGPRAALTLLSTILATATCAGVPSPVRGAAPEQPARPAPTSPEDPPAPAADPFAEPPPRDPDDAPFLAPPRNQLPQWSAGRRARTWRGFDDDHWVQLTATPIYSVFHVPFIGRGGASTRGGGIGLELDVRVQRWLFVRVYGSHTLHPAFEESSYDEDDEVLTLTANEGLLQATNTGGAIVYALDIGRYVPRVDVGAGLLFVRTPEAAQDGQWGGECRQGGVCDLGLACSTQNVCRPSPVFEVHAGIGLDILLGQRWSLGLAVRYYALLSALDALPFYLQGSARLSVRF